MTADRWQSMNDQKVKRLYFVVEASWNRKKLSDFLFEHVRGLSKMYLRELVRDGKCEVNGAHENAGYRLRANDLVEIEADLSRGKAMQPQEMPLKIVFEDPHIIVVNKPAGILVHPTHRDKSGTLLNALVHHTNDGRDPNDGFVRPSLPHRLDKQTSGLITAAKSVAAHRRLSSDFHHKRVEKRYLALVEGLVEADSGEIDVPVGRFAEEKRWSVKGDGKHSISRYAVRERFADTTLLELEPVTGRTNQLRIHCQAIGHPIVGDTSRGGRPFQRLCLHACRLAFKHPIDGNSLQFESALPNGFLLTREAR